MFHGLVLRLALLLALAGPLAGCDPAASRSHADLPPEAVATLALIRDGGPFPYRKDGSVFQNRERLLPAKPRGYYREYTVPTPGARDRGARRIVTGLFGAFLSDIRLLPPEFQARAREDAPRAISDYIAGMTDRFAILEHRRLFSIEET